MTSEANWKQVFVPFSFHGDGVPITGIGKTWAKMMHMFHISSLVGTGLASSLLFLVWGVFDKLCKDGANGTMHTFFKILAWSFYWLFQGVWPTNHWNTGEPYDPGSAEGKRAGTPLANGYRGVLWAILGDLDYLAGKLGLPRYNAKKPCSWCQCTNTGELSFTDMRSTAKWIETIWTAALWKAWPGRSKNPLFSLRGVSILTVCPDYMHLKYLGSDQYMFGSCLYLLVHEVMPKPTPEENLQLIWDFLKKWYKHNKVPYQFKYLTKLSMFTRKKSFPKLRGTAAEIRYFGPALRAAWQEWMNPNLNLHLQIKLMLDKNVRMEEILTECKGLYRLPAAKAREFQTTAFQMGQLQNAIAIHFADEYFHPLFDVTSKVHMVMHSAMWSKHVSPRLVWCFMGEDQMARDQRLAQSCVKGNTGASAVVKMLSHYKLGLHLKMRQH